MYENGQQQVSAFEYEINLRLNIFFGSTTKIDGLYINR